MDISINAKVTCTDGPGGQSTHVILMPTTEKITHVVVRHELFPEIRYLVSIDHVVESTPESIRLDCSREQLWKMPVFDPIEFLPSELSGADAYLKWPFYAPVANRIRLDNVEIPANELAIRRGTDVEATDGAIGHVDEFLINPDNDHITHLVLREDHLWGQKDVTIPVSQIDHYEANTVYLKLDKHGIEALPAIPIRRTPSKRILEKP
jgi:hypothetical protein